jgi:uncharacterized protein
VKNANLVWKVVFGSMVAALLAVLTGCGGAEAAPPENTKPASHYFPVTVGDRTVHLQLAVTEAEMEQGLMYRRDLRSNQGMLFIYRQPQKVSFWMRNTPTPLDIGYFTSDGVLREIYPLYPFDERAVPSKADNIQYALEVCQGWFDATGVKPGDRIDLAAVAAAMRERGFSTKNYKGLK